MDARYIARTNPFILDTLCADAVYPLGKVLAIGTLVDCQPTESIAGTLSRQERDLGNYGPGRWAWVFQDIQPLPEPIQAKGTLGIWEWTPPRSAAVAR